MPAYNTSTGVCLTPECIQLAADALANLHPNYQNMDPCDNFAKFACGGYPTRFRTQPKNNVITQVGQNSQQIIVDLLQSTTFSPTSPDDKAIWIKIKTSWDTCMNTAAIEEEGPANLLPLVSRVTSLFPVDSYSSNATLSTKDYDSIDKAVTYLASLGVPWVAQFDVNQDLRNADLLLPAVIPQPVKAEGIPAVEEVVQIIQTLTSNSTTKNVATQLANRVVSFQQAFVELVAPVDLSKAPELASTTTIDKLGGMAPAVGIAATFKALVPKNYTNQDVVVAWPELLAQASALVLKTPKAVLQISLALSLYGKFATALDFKSDGRSETCLKSVEGAMGWIAAKFYLDDVYAEGLYSDEVLAANDKVVTELRSTFKDIITTLPWMDDATKQVAKGKVDGITQKIGFPTVSPNACNSTNLKQYYAGLDVSDSFLNNTVASSQWAVGRTFGSLSNGAKLDRSAWLDGGGEPWVANAFYRAMYNDISFPVGFSLRPIFSPKYPSYWGFGGFAYVGGHEITHGFDNTGREYDLRGNRRETWSNSSVAGFQSRTQCLVDQFNGYDVLDDDFLPFKPAANSTTPLRVDGALTLGENIADLGGIIIAYQAWQRREAQEKQRAQALPGLEAFTNEQMFFLANANLWCVKNSHADLIEAHTADNHSPNLERIRGITENSPDFIKAFNCKKKTVNCQLW